METLIKQKTNTELYIGVLDKYEKSTTYYVILPYGDDEDYISIDMMNGVACYELHVHEGYMITTYFFPLERYEIRSLSTYN